MVTVQKNVYVVFQVLANVFERIQQKDNKMFNGHI